MPPYTLDLDRRANALTELLDCQVRWASREYVLNLSQRFMAKCANHDRHDLSDRIRSKVADAFSKF